MPAKSTYSDRWIPSGKTVSVAGRDLGGMIYVKKTTFLSRLVNGMFETDSSGDHCNSEVNPSLKVAQVGSDIAGYGMDYWPDYSHIGPKCRATYLDWLARGRCDPSYSVGYVFLYFYGIENRFFRDNPSKDEKIELVSEARRLLNIYSHNRSIRGYLGNFIDVAELAIFGARNVEPVFEKSGYSLPISVKVSIGNQIRNEKAISAEWALSWLICHPDCRFRTPAVRCFAEFKELFLLQFNEKYPHGLAVNVPRKGLKVEYNASSGRFVVNLTPTMNNQPIPDISNLHKTVNTVQKIAEAATTALEKYSRFIGRYPDQRGKISSHFLLPSELWPVMQSQEIDEFNSWILGFIEGDGLVPAIDVIARLTGKPVKNITRGQLTDAADALARLGFGLAPDPRYGIRAPTTHEPVVLFSLGKPVELLEDVSASYQSSLLEMALATFIANSDGRISPAERQSLVEKAASSDNCNDQEKRRLQANLTWFLQVPPDIKSLRRKLTTLDVEHHHAIRTTIMHVAHADGTISAKEVSGIEKIYKSLGLDPSLVYSDIHSREIDTGPKTVRKARQGTPGEPIPSEGRITLDAAKIEKISADTRRASELLANIFSNNDGAREESPDDDISTLSEIDGAHESLIRELIRQEHWSTDGFRHLCNSLGLMHEGALETINEWAFKVYDSAILDEYEGYHVSEEVSRLLHEQIAKENSDVKTKTT